MLGACAAPLLQAVATNSSAALTAPARETGFAFFTLAVANRRLPATQPQSPRGCEKQHPPLRRHRTQCRPALLRARRRARRVCRVDRSRTQIRGGERARIWAGEKDL